jgi:hypothetical protein
VFRNGAHEYLQDAERFATEEHRAHQVAILSPLVHQAFELVKPGFQRVVYEAVGGTGER